MRCKIISLKKSVATIREFQKYVKFSNGKYFILDNYVGEGDTSKVWSIGDGLVLKMLKDGRSPMYIDMFYHTIKAVNREGVPTVEIVDYLQGKYVISKEENIKCSLDNFYIRYSSIDQEEREQLEKDLIDFAVKTAVFGAIPDAKPDNIVYTRDRGWILLDAGNSFSKLIRFDNYPFEVKYNIFTGHRDDDIYEHVIPWKLLGKITSAINEARQVLQSNEEVLASSY